MSYQRAHTDHILMRTEENSAEFHNEKSTFRTAVSVKAEINGILLNYTIHAMLLMDRTNKPGSQLEHAHLISVSKPF